jgi:transposase
MGGRTSRLRRLNRLKPLRRIATRYEKRAVNDKAKLRLAVILLLL